MLRINLIKHHICVWLMTGSECDYFVVFCHPFEETDCIWPDCDVGLGNWSIFNFNRKNQVIRFGRVLFTMEDGLVDIDQQGFLTFITLISGKVDLSLLEISECRWLYFIIIPKNLKGNVQMVKCSFVLALKSRNQVREIVTLDLEMREIDGIVRSCKLTETANRCDIFIFCRGFRLLEV